MSPEMEQYVAAFQKRHHMRDGESAHDLFARLLDEDIAETFAKIEKQMAARVGS